MVADLERQRHALETEQLKVSLELDKVKSEEEGQQSAKSVE